MPVRLTSVVFESDDPKKLVSFWTNSGRESLPGGEYRGTLDDPDIKEPALELRFTPRHRAKVGKNRIHLDLNTVSMHEYNGNLDGYTHLPGVRRVDIGQGELVPWTVFADQEDNEFCLLKPRDRYQDSGRIAAVVVDSVEPAALAAFWAAASGWPVVDDDPAFASLRMGDEVGPFLEFSRVADRNPSPSPVSLGFESYWAHQLDGDVATIVELGATVVRREERYTVLADPEGNEFRVMAPQWPPPRRRSI